MNRQDLSYNEKDDWTWSRAQPEDLNEIVALMDQFYSVEINDIFTKNPTKMHYQLLQATIEQSYVPTSQLITVARRRSDNRVIAWGWLLRGKYLPYANEEMAVAEIAHTELTLGTRSRIRLVGQLLESWILWCEVNQIPVLCSTSIREDQTGFMRLHDIYGFSRKGSFAYRRCA